MLQHLLRENAITVGLEADDRESAIRQLVEGLPEESVGLKDRENLVQLLLQREHFGTTAIGDGIAMPHCTFSGISFPVAAFGISRKGIDYSSLDGEPVHVVFLCVFPEVADVSSLKRRILQPVESVLRDRFLRERLKVVDDAAEAYELLMRETLYSLPTLKLAQ